MIHRPRRLRSSAGMRSLLKDVVLNPSDFIQPLFVIEGKNKKQKIQGIDDNYKLSIDNLVAKVQQLYDIGVRGVMLFPCIEESLKGEYGPEAINPDNLMCRAIKAIKDKVPQMVIASDVALDPYTNHGHDGVLNKDGTDIDNDATVSILARQAKVLAMAGSDAVCPSDMMDGKVEAIRYALEESGFVNTAIASYSVKYASNLYGPFRNALGIKGLKGPQDKKTYQMDFCSINQPTVKVELDIAEGSDIVIVKPAGFYLDVITNISSSFPMHVWAYQVSGEYQMINSMVNSDHILFESLIAIKRSGASNIITYGAERIINFLNEKNT